MTTAAPGLEETVAWLATQRGAMVDLLRDLVEASSATADPAGVAAVLDVLEPALARAGLTTQRLASARFGPHLAFRGPAAGAPVLLVGHADTVFPRELFAGFRVEGDRAFGPGVFDMKGGLVVMALGLAAATRAGLLARLPVSGLVVSDEEVGSPESQPLLRGRARGAACALVFESGRPGDLVVTRRKGVASLRAEARGVAAHAGNEPEKGRSAIWALARFVDRVQALSDPARGRSVNVGTFQGGTSKNTVPDRAACDVDLRYLTSADGRALEEALRDVAREAALPGTHIELTRGGVRAPLERTPASAALAAEYGACQQVCGLGLGEAPLAGGGSDACTTSEAGVPSIDGLGPRGAGYHTTAEEVDLTSLVPKAQALVRFLAGRAAAR
jgi:glutamate carboxypeptidase